MAGEQIFLEDVDKSLDIFMKALPGVVYFIRSVYECLDQTQLVRGRGETKKTQ